jgi:hypothetical protein
VALVIGTRVGNTKECVGNLVFYCFGVCGGSCDAHLPAIHSHSPQSITTATTTTTTRQKKNETVSQPFSFVLPHKNTQDGVVTMLHSTG